MGLFSKDSFKITDGACTVTFEKSGEVTEKRVNKIFSSSKVQACRAVNVKFGEKVTSIGDRAFFACSQLAGIEIPRSVTSIGFWAFGHCARLESIEIPGNVISIGKNAFEHCQSLKNIRIHEGVTSIGDYAFSYCKGLTNIEFPSSIASIGLKVFDNCPKLASITVENGNTSYKSIDGNLYSHDGNKLLKYAIGKTDSTFEIPAGVTDIGIYAFENCVNLTSVKIHEGVTRIGDWAFSGCDNLTVYCEVEAIPKGWNLSNCPVVLKDKGSKTLRKRVLDREDSEDSYKIENGICKVYFSEYGELTKERVNKILELPDVALCKEINVITSQNVTGIDFWAFHRIDNSKYLKSTHKIKSSQI